MAKSLRNTTGSLVEVVDTGVSIAASATYLIAPQDFPLWAASIDVDTLIDAGTLVVNDGYDDLKPNFGKLHIHEESIPRISSLIAAATVVATANTTTTLTVTSRPLFVFTGAVAGQIVRLPEANLLQVGHAYEFWNVSNQTVVLQDNAGNSLFAISASQKTSVVLQVNTTAAGTWLFEANFQGGTGGGNGCLNFGYNGTAGNNRWLEVIGNNPSNGTPFTVAGVKAIRALSISTDINSTVTVTIFKNTVALDTITLAGTKKNSKINLNHILLDQDQLSCQITSGSISRPCVTLWL